MKMMFFSPKKSSDNVRRQSKVKTSRKLSFAWLRPMLQLMVAAVIVAGLGLGGLQLNEKLAVAYWDIECDTHIHKQIEDVLNQQPRDFWHTRAGLLQDILRRQVPDIKTIEVSRMLPDGLLIKAVARTPIALWENTEVSPAVVMLVDEDAQIYRGIKAGEQVDLPLIRLPQSQVTLATRLLHTMQAKAAHKWMRLSEVIAERDAWRLNFSYGEQWHLNAASLETDIQQAMRVLALPEWEKGVWRLDARIPQRWFIRPAKQEVI